jgi:hypothetical protein
MVRPAESGFLLLASRPSDAVDQVQDRALMEEIVCQEGGTYEGFQVLEFTAS